MNKDAAAYVIKLFEKEKYMLHKLWVHPKFIKLKKFRLLNVFFLFSFYTEHAVRYAVKVSLTNLKDDQLEG